MINLDAKALIILNLIIITAFYSCEDSTPSPEEILEGLVISPNPFCDSILIEIKGKAKRDFYYELYDPFGKIIKSDEFKITLKKQYMKIIDLRDLETGIYLIRIEYRDSNVVKKLIKQATIDG